ncbi:MAG: hypothetical protein IJL72_03175 [Lachnospiraceae bacterium]|nr:hypothetical protein [Lachnospiraceae bacterium]
MADTGPLMAARKKQDRMVRSIRLIKKPRCGTMLFLLFDRGMCSVKEMAAEPQKEDV